MMSGADETRGERDRPGRVAIAAAAVTLGAGAIAFAAASQHAAGLDRADTLTAVGIIGLLAVAAVLPPRSALLTVLALAVVWLGGYQIYAALPDWIETPVPVHDAVGAGAFFISSYLDQQLAGALLVGVVLAGGVALALSGRPVVPAPPAATSGARQARAVGLAVAVVILTLLPDLQRALIDGTHGPLPGGWDAANLTAWDAFRHRGLVPMRDYWYPYGATWLLTDFPTGPLVRWLWHGGMLAAGGWALWRLIGPKPIRIALCLLGLVAVAGLDRADSLDHPAAWRYMPAFVVALFYAAVGPLRHRRLTDGHLVLAVACAGAGTVEATVLMVGLGGAAFVALGEFVFDPALRAWRTAHAALVDLVPVLVGVGITLSFWLATASFEENLRWFTSFGAVSAASAAAQEQHGALVGLQLTPAQVTLLATMPALTLAAAFALRRCGANTGKVPSALLLAATGCATVMLAKHLVRPQGPILIVIPVVALLWVVIVQWQARSIRSAIAAGLFAGALLGMLQASAMLTPTRYLENALTTPARALRDVRLGLDRDRVRAAGNRRFAASRFAALPEKVYIADKIAGGLAGARFAVLGDVQLLYVLFGQRPPGHISLYDAAPTPEQQRWINAVRSRRPRLLVWHHAFAVDSVPYPVRNPLVFSYAVASYVPQIASHPMDLLRRRRPGEPVAVRYWGSRIGNVVDLGGIPSYSRGAELDRCRSGAGCAPYAIVTGPSRATGPRVTIRLGGTPYGVAFSTREGVERYAVRLDRLWFWPYAGGDSARLRSSDPSWTVERVNVRGSSDLY